MKKSSLKEVHWKTIQQITNDHNFFLVCEKSINVEHQGLGDLVRHFEGAYLLSRKRKCFKKMLCKKLFHKRCSRMKIINKGLHFHSVNFRKHS